MSSVQMPRTAVEPPRRRRHASARSPGAAAIDAGDATPRGTAHRRAGRGRGPRRSRAQPTSVRDRRRCSGCHRRHAPATDRRRRLRWPAAPAASVCAGARRRRQRRRLAPAPQRRRVERVLRAAAPASSTRHRIRSTTAPSPASGVRARDRGEPAAGHGALDWSCRGRPASGWSTIRRPRCRCATATTGCIGSRRCRCHADGLRRGL